MPTVPADFQPHFRASPVTAPWEPLYSRAREAAIDIGFEVREAHCNARGFLHGGVLAALCDNAMGLSMYRVLNDEQIGIVTTNLAIDYIASAQIDQFVQIEPRVIRAGGSTGVCDALVTVDGSPIARANASFRLMRRTPTTT
jgi:uncharacterized protein (TIGR00369 family)